MRKTIVTVATVLSASLASAESAIQQFNDTGYGTLSGRLQSLSMYRDYENGANNYGTSLGIQLNYLSPEMAGWSVGASYTGAGVLDAMDYGTSTTPGEYLLSNGRINLLNEAFLRYDMGDLGLTNTTATLGRLVSNGEVFRADDYRQKKRAIEAVMIESGEFHKTRLTAGHAWRLSNWMSSGDLWEFNDFGDVFTLSGAPAKSTDGVTWGELVNTCVDGLEVAVFDAVAYDEANLLGLRAQYALTEKTSLLAYYRNECDIGSAAAHEANVLGLSIVQKIESVTLEGGYFGVYGDTLRFQEMTTGINHALGVSMMIYGGQFNGDTDTVYAKATTKIKKTGTVLYGLVNSSWHDVGAIRSAQELNVVVKQPLPKLDNVDVAFKGGIGYRDVEGGANTTATDARIFVTYTF